ncbi:MAG: patatin-like phospholipase family protein [Nitrospirota bacterium]
MTKRRHMFFCRFIFVHLQILVLCLTALWYGGCVQATPRLSEFTPRIPATTHANLHLGDKERRDGRFVGLAISGGGSRAAVFGGAVLKELNRLGVLGEVDVLSAVSGGGLPAAHYALDGYGTIDFANGFMERMGHDFQSDVRGRWLSPPNLLRYWFTDATRSDIVVKVFDDELFHGATYADLNPNRPKLLLNATNALTGEPFVISDESFATLDAPLASYSLARAVYMSAAYPGVFEPVVLRNGAAESGGSSRPAVLAYDGGSVDNLGVTTVLNLLNKIAERESFAAAFPNGCLVLSVDATPRIGRENTQPLTASTVLLQSNRREVLERVGIPADQQDRTMFGTFTVGRNGSGSACRFWHLSLRQLSDEDSLGARAARMKTSLGLDPADQEALVRAAERLVQYALREAEGREIVNMLVPRTTGKE